MQICTSLQRDNHASTPPLSFLQAGCSSCRPTNSVKALKGLHNVERREKIPMCWAAGRSYFSSPSAVRLNPVSFSCYITCHSTTVCQYHEKLLAFHKILPPSCFYYNNSKAILIIFGRNAGKGTLKRKHACCKMWNVLSSGLIWILNVIIFAWIWRFPL